MRSDLLARYVIGEPNYENEFIVYPAEDQRMKRSVFIVVPDLALKADKGRFERVWTSINEAKQLSPLRFVEIEDLIPPTAEDDNFYIVERRPSRTLRQYLDEQDMLGFEKAGEIGRHILEGLATLHGAGFAHNALTDQCIYVSEDYSGLSVRIGNLHLISKIGEHIVPPYVPEFGAPEIYSSGIFSASPTLDIYAMGMIAYKLFLPRQTYADVFHSVLIWEDEHQREQSWKNVHLDPSNVLPRLDVLIPGFPVELAGLIERMQSRDPAGRPPMAADALQEFRSDTLGRQMAPQPINQAAEPKKKARKWTAGKMAMIAALVLICTGVGIVTVPRILGPDPELVASVEAWKAEAESRRAKAVAAKAPERLAQDEAKLAFDEGTGSMATAAGSVESGEYEKALAHYKDAAVGFGNSLVAISKDDAAKAKATASEAGAAGAPAFAEADKRMAAAADSASAGDPGAAIKAYGTTKTEFGELAEAFRALADARKAATEKHDVAERMGGGDLPEFGKAQALLTEAQEQAGQWQANEAAKGYGDAAGLFDAVITDILAAKDGAAALKQKVVELSASIVERGGGLDPEFTTIQPQIAAADERFGKEAYKLAAAAYPPIMTVLETLSARGFCPVSPDLAFEKIDAGSYPVGNVRLMTSSLSKLGSMLGAANGAITIEKPFCIQTRAVTRADMAAYYTAISDAEGMRDYSDNPLQPADDVPLQAAQDYARWLSGRLNTIVHLPSAMEWMAGATTMAGDVKPDTDDILLQWSTTPCEAGGNVAFLAQEGSTFVVCSDTSAGGLFRIAAELR